MTNIPEVPKPPCALYATALPELRAGSLSPFERQALRTHLQDCATCREQAEADSTQVIDDAIRRHFGIPTEAAPFLTLDDIRHRAAVLAQSDLDGHSAPYANDILMRRVDKGVIMQMKPAQNTIAHPDATPTRVASRWRASAAIVSVVALVAVFALVVHSFSTARTTNQHNPATGIAHPGSWVQQYEVKAPGGALVVAPGDPSVLYKLTGSLSFQRSDDGGKTWTTYAAPSQKVASDPSASLTLQVSPLNAQVIFATIYSDPANPRCPQVGYKAETTPSGTNQLSMLAAVSGGYTCTFQYVSTDGGSTWTTPQVPTKGDLGQFYFTGGSHLTPPFVAQGNRLYTSLAADINGPQPTGFRLVSSTDGIHWSAADAPLVAQNLTVYEYAATPSGSTLFATTLPATSAGGFDRELWRSDDAGAHWTDLGAFPESSNPEGTTYLVGAGTIGGKAVVYYGTGTLTTVPVPTPSASNPDPGIEGIAPENVYGSIDNGKTWQAAPSANIPTNLRAAPLSLGTLDDGSLILMYDTQLGSMATSKSASRTIAFDAWKPGDSAWTRLSSSLAVAPNMLLEDSTATYLWFTPAHESSPATIQALILGNNVYTLWSCTLG